MIGFIGCSGCLQRSAGILQGDEHNQKRLLAKIHRKIGLTVSFCVFFFQRPFGLGTSQVSKLPELHFFNFFTTAFQCRAAARGGFGLGEGHGRMGSSQTVATRSFGFCTGVTHHSGLQAAASGCALWPLGGQRF